MTMKKIKVAAIQLISGPDVAANLARARHWMAAAAAQGAQLVALPEYFCLMGLKDDDKLLIAEPPGQGTIQQALADAARELGLWIIGGTLPLRTADPARVRNSCLVFDPAGTQAARYDKIHLFAYDNGRERYDEGRVLEAGSQPASVQCGPLRVALSVCYDLRFPELYRRPGELPPDLISVPAAFTYTTGEAHWELLLRARAVENLAFVIAPAQGGRHQNGRRTWGHTMIVDPWGQVLDCLPEGEGLALAELDLARLASLRQQLPALQHRRL